MTATLTPSPNLNASVVVPASGEPRTALSVRTPFQALLDRVGGIIDGPLFTFLDSPRELNVQTGGSRTSFAIDVGPIASVVLRDSGGGSYVHSYAGGTGTVTQAHVGGNDLGAAAKAWYVYAYRNAGNLAWEVSDVAPNGARTLKSTDNTRRYYGTFITDSAGAPIPMRAVGGVYTFRLSAAGTAVRALNATPGGTPAATAFTNVDLSPLLPPHARLARLYAVVTSADTTNWGDAQFRTDGETGYRVDVHCPPAGASQDAAAALAFDLETSSARVIEYRRENAASYADIAVALFVYGWKE